MSRLSEEEKKAIEYLENRLDILHNNTQWATENSIKVVLNLIDKQQKEINRLQNIKRKDIQDLINNENENIYKNYISKNKIRTLLHSYAIDDENFKKYLEEMLKEN